tara:strand:+ start:3667 stop:5712 length:2046 start_codon:yes stop_codon:yes gene_type:complete
MSLSISGAIQGTTSGLGVGAALAATPYLGPLAIPIGAALMGTAGALFGGGRSAPSMAGKKTKKYIRDLNKYTLDSLKKDVALAIQLEEKAKILYEAEADRAFNESMKDYNLYLKQRKSDHKVATAQFKDSVRAFDETVDLNDISATIAINDAMRLRTQRLEELGNQSQALMLELELGKTSTELNKELIRSQMASSIKDANLSKRGIEQDLRIAVRDGERTVDSNTRTFEFDAAVASAKTKAQEAELAAQGELIDADMVTMEGEQDAIIKSGKLKRQDVLNSLQNSSAEAAFANQTLQLQQDERYAESAIQTDELRRQGLLEQGAQIAKGQAGRSALKSVQGIAFANEQAQALVASAITRADAKYLIDKNQIVQQLTNFRNQADSELQSSAIGLDKSSADFKAGKLKMSAQRRQLDSLKQDSKIQSLTINNRKADTIAANELTALRVSDAGKLSQLNLDKLSSMLLQSQEQYQNQLVNSDLAQFSLAAQTQLSMNSLRSARQSATDQFKLSKERIKFDEFLSNKAAESQILDEPKLPALLPPPNEAPPLVSQPMPDVDWKRIKKLMDKARRAKTYYDPSAESQFAQMQQNIVNIAQQAGAIAKTFQKPEQVIKQPSYQPKFGAAFNTTTVPNPDTFYATPINYTPAGGTPQLAFDSSNVSFDASSIDFNSTPPIDYSTITQQ